VKILEYCSCGYKGGHWFKHRETSVRWGHRLEDHMWLGWIEVIE
jgi:hypothetical protein